MHCGFAFVYPSFCNLLFFEFIFSGYFSILSTVSFSWLCILALSDEISLVLWADTKVFKAETLEQTQSLRTHKRCYKNTELASGIVPPHLQFTVGVNIYSRGQYKLRFAVHCTKKTPMKYFVDMSCNSQPQRSVCKVTDDGVNVRDSIHGPSRNMSLIIGLKLAWGPLVPNTELGPVPG